MKKLTQKTLRRIQIFWSVFIGLGAYVGAAMMFVTPTGEMFGIEPLLPLLGKLPLSTMFFVDFIWPGIALLFVNGFTNTAAFILLMKQSKYGSFAGIVCGIVLMLWTAVQFVIFTFNFMSTTFFVFGALQALNGYLPYRTGE